MKHCIKIFIISCLFWLIVLFAYCLFSVQTVSDKWIEPNDTVKVLCSFKLNDTFLLTKRTVIDGQDYVIVARNYFIRSNYYVDSLTWTQYQIGSTYIMNLGENDKTLKRIFVLK